MRAGNLRHRVLIEQRQLAQDGRGDPVETWTAFAEAWAAVEPLSGRERFAARQEGSEVTTRVRLRYLAGVTPEMRLSFAGRLYDIEAVIDPDERHRALVLLCVERG